MDKKRNSSEKEEEDADAMNTDGNFEDANETPTEGTDGTGREHRILRACHLQQLHPLRQR